MRVLFILLSLSISLIAGNYEKGLDAYKQYHYKAAKTYFEKSAKEGNASAQYYLGKLYDKGQGIKKDRNTALKWYIKAEKNGDKMAKKRMDTLRKNTRSKHFELVDTVTIMGIKIFLDISMLVDAPSGGGIIYSVNFRKGSHKKKDFTDGTDKRTFEFLNYRIKSYNTSAVPKVTTPQRKTQ